MHPLEKEIAGIVRRQGLLARGDVVVTGVSGGPDSMALLHVLAALTADLGIAQIAVYVDHGLRPDEVEAEKLLIQEQAHSLGLVFRHIAVDVKAAARQRGLSIEHAARDLRYAFFEKIATDHGARKIVVAHTADDQAEEVLLRLIRGTGRAGLSGMKMIRAGKVIRPLLTTSKEKLLAYLEDRHLPFLIDSSNLERKYLRNRIRLDLLPDLQKLNPNISETLRQTAQVLGDEESLLVALTETAWNEIAMLQQNDVLSVLIDLASFLSLERAIQRRIVEKAFIVMQSRPQFKKIEQVLYLAEKGEGKARLHFSKGLRLKKSRESLCFSYPQGRVARRGDLEDG